MFLSNLYLISHVDPLSTSAQGSWKVAKRSYNEYYGLQLKVAEWKLRAATMCVMFHIRVARK